MKAIPIGCDFQRSEDKCCNFRMGINTPARIYLCVAALFQLIVI